MVTRRRFLTRVLVLGLVGATALGFAGCGGEGKASEPKPLAEYFPIRIGDRVARLQIAVQRAEQQRGLMERTTLGADDGMLFIYQQPQQMSFWMHNTLLPLDIGFFDGKGELREVRQLVPHDERSVKSRSAEIVFAVEMNQNWFRDRGVKPGAKLDVAALKAALQARGAEAQRYPLE